MFHRTYKIIMWSISKTCKTLENITFYALRHQSDYWFFKPLKGKTTDRFLHLAFHWARSFPPSISIYYIKHKPIGWYRHQPWEVSQRYFCISVITWFARSQHGIQELCHFVINSAEVKLNPRTFGFNLNKRKDKIKCPFHPELNNM